MPASALLLALAAALIHAIWNLLLSGTDDTHGATAVAMVTGAVVFAPLAAATWKLEAAAVPYAAASAGLETLYFALLAAAYARAAMSFVYPIARGSAPVFVLALSTLALGAAVSAVAAIGVLCVGLGIVLVHGLKPGHGGRDLPLALGVGACIAGYTLVDKHGVAHAHPIAYFELVLSAAALVYLATVWRMRGGQAIRDAVSGRSVIAGIGFFGAYALVLEALTLASAPSVAAVRESGVVMAMAMLAISGRERITRRRFAGALAVVAGVVLVSLG